MMIESDAFNLCMDLENIEFLEGRVSLGRNERDTGAWNRLFWESRIGKVVLPSTMREVSLDVFRNCANLKVLTMAKDYKV